MTELVDSNEPDFFAPCPSDLVDSLIGQYESDKASIINVSDFIGNAINAKVIHYFTTGNCEKNQAYGLHLKAQSKSLFDSTGAISALNSAYWSKAMHLTDVLDYMPQKRRDAWHESIDKMTCPNFEESTVRSTLESLLAMRSQFLAERVDGIFTGLSGEHVTNSPAAFGKRMIFGGVLSSFGYGGTHKCGLINDLRCVIAKFMGRDEPKYSASDQLVKALQGSWGQWVTVDGGALKIRLYKKGTAHLEIHPDMAWRLNSILAYLHPMAIPAEFRQAPKRKQKEIELIQRPLPFAVLDILGRMEQAYNLIKKENDWRNQYRRENIPNSLKFGFGTDDKHVTNEAKKVLESIGGAWQSGGYFQFEYNPAKVISEIVVSGCIPDDKSHQYYPTPENLAKIAVELAMIGDSHLCLEPSAGIGGIAGYMSVGWTTCVEVSPLRCRVLEEKGYKVHCADFLKWECQTKFDRIVMNPPFDRGQWQTHLERAAQMLDKGGRLVAILPASAQGKSLLPECQLEWHGVYDNEFAGASVSVVMLVANKQK